MRRIEKSADEVRMLLIMRPAHTDKGRSVDAGVMFRLDCAEWIEAALRGEVKS